MDKQVLTLEILGKYINAKIIYEGKVWEIQSIDFLTGYIQLYEIVQYDVMEPQDYKKFDNEALISDCALQLRVLSSLTKEEREKIRSIGYDRKQDKIIFDSYMLIYNRPKDADYYDDCYESDIETIDYLRSINIDIDNLIQSGVAEEVR